MHIEEFFKYILWVLSRGVALFLFLMISAFVVLSFSFLIWSLKLTLSNFFIPVDPDGNYYVIDSKEKSQTNILKENNG